ncbi:MAG: nucleotide exchange factor GrpE [Planctomycetota bacterium]
MKKPGEPPAEEFAITERPIPLKAWEPEDVVAPLAALEGDVRDLMRRFAEAEFALSQKDKEHHEQTREMLLAVLGVVDAFERVFRSISAKPDRVDRQMKKWIGNFRTVHRMLRTVLTDQAVSRIENLDQGFDPRWHKAVETLEDSSRAEGTIAEEVLPGYVWHEELLRPAEVIVVQHPAAED